MSKIERHDLKTVRKKEHGDVAMDSAQKSDWVEYQMRQATLGDLDSISCPYCGTEVLLGVDELCCKPMGAVTGDLLQRMEDTSSSDAADMALLSSWPSSALASVAALRRTVQ